MPTTRFMHLPLDAIGPVWGFVVASISGAFLYVAQVTGDALPAVVQTWLEGGFSIAFVISLLYGIVTLWKRLNDRDTYIESLNEEIRTDWKTQNERLIAVLEKIDRDDR